MPGTICFWLSPLPVGTSFANAAPSPRPSAVMGSALVRPFFLSLLLDECSRKVMPKPAAPGQGEEACGMAAVTQVSMRVPVMAQHPLSGKPSVHPRHLLRPQLTTGHWRASSGQTQGSAFVSTHRCRVFTLQNLGQDLCSRLNPAMFLVLVEKNLVTMRMCD